MIKLFKNLGFRLIVLPLFGICLLVMIFSMYILSIDDKVIDSISQKIINNRFF